MTFVQSRAFYIMFVFAQSRAFCIIFDFAQLRAFYIIAGPAKSIGIDVVQMSTLYYLCLHSKDPRLSE